MTDTDPPLHPSPRADRRHRRGLLDGLMAEHGVTAMVLPVRREDHARLAFLADCVVRVDGTGEAVAVIVPTGDALLLADSHTTWSADTGDLVARSVESVGSELVELADGGPVGVIGFDPTGSIEMHLLDAGVPMVPLGPSFDALRRVKSERDITDVEHAAYIADRCFEGIVAGLLPGRTEAQIAARIHEMALAMGASDVEVVAHHAAPGGLIRLSSDQPGAAVASVGSMLLCTITVAGSRGHRAALGRPIVFGELDEPTECAARGAGSALAAVARHAVPGTSITALEGIAARAAADEGAVLHGSTICGIGLAPVERPFAPSDLVQAGDVLRVSCTCTSDGGIGVQTDTLVIDDRVARRLSATAIGVFAPEFHRAP